MPLAGSAGLARLSIIAIASIQDINVASNSPH